MSQQSGAQMHMHPRAEAELAQFTKLVYWNVENGILTEEQGWDEIQKKTVELLVAARVMTDGERLIQSQCSDCKRVARMKSDVIAWQCVCSPNVYRKSWENPVPLA